MSNQKEIIFTLITEKEGYGIYYAIPTGKIKTGNEKTIMFVMKDNEIIYLPTNKRSQFHMKRACDEFIEERLQ